MLNADTIEYYSDMKGARLLQIRSDVLINLRKNHNLRQVDVAGFTGIARSQLSQLESGNNPSASINTLQKLAAFYKISLDSLISDEPKLEQTSRNRSLDAILSQAMAEALSNQPVAIPVVTLPVVGRIHAPSDALDVIDEDEVLDYVYLSRQQISQKNVICLIIEDQCLAPEIEEGDIVVVDLNNRHPKNGWIVVVQLRDARNNMDKVKIMRYREETNWAWLEDDTETIECGNAEIKGVAIQVNKNLVR